MALYKNCNKLPQILARVEAEAAGFDEALLLNSQGEVAEAASSNLFWMEGDALFTTPLAAGILAGVTRQVMVDICRRLGVAFVEKAITPDTLLPCQGVILTLSSLGIVEISHLGSQPLASSPLTQRFWDEYWRVVQEECGGL
jgi:branched-subunit amino acid aminotransferase/4-amino-4-deoxychorismate lyase